MGENAPVAAAHLVAEPAALGEVKSKSMFGGFGVFSDGIMFALIDPEGEVFLRIPPGEDSRFEERHGRMPYGRIPASVPSEADELERWARESLAAAIAAKR